MRLKAGVDTYAFTSLLEVKTARRLSLPVVAPKTRLNSIDGASLSLVGESNLRVRLLGRSEWVTIPVVVVDHMSTSDDIDILLGVSAHRRLGTTLTVDFANHRVEYVGAIREVISDNVGEDCSPSDQPWVSRDAELTKDVKSMLIEFPRSSDSRLVSRKYSKGQVVGSKPPPGPQTALFFDTKDFTVYFNPTDRWSVEWKWKAGSEPSGDGPMVPAIYRKRWFTEEILEIALEELQQWLDSGILRHARNVDGDRYRWLPINLVEQLHKPTTPIRVTLDLTSLNKLIKFTPEVSWNESCLESLREWRRQGNGFLVDIRRAFLMVKIVEHQRKYLRVKIGEDLFEMTVMPFGLVTAPKILLGIMRLILSAEFPNVLFFRDDIFCRSQIEAAGIKHVLLENGFETKPPEEISPTMVEPVKVLGLTIYNVDGVPTWSRTERQVGDWNIQGHDSWTLRRLSGWLAVVLPSGTVPLAGWLRPAIGILRSWCGSLASEFGWDKQISQINGKKRIAIFKIVNYISARLEGMGNPMQGVWEVTPSGEYCLYTDASEDFLGYVITCDGRKVYDGCFVVPDSTQINQLELDAVVEGVQAMIDLQITKFDLYCDNNTVLAWVRKLELDEKITLTGMHRKLIERRLNLIRKLLLEYGLTIGKIQYVNTKDNPADELTRIGNKVYTIGSVTQMTAQSYWEPCPKAMQSWNTGISVEIFVEKIHQELIHPSKAVTLEILKRAGIIIDRAIETVVMQNENRCGICLFKRARLKKWQSSGKSYTPGAQELFADTYKCNGTGEETGVVTMLHADTRLAMVWPFVGAVDSEKVMMALLNWFAVYGTPKILRSDNGSEFVNHKVAEFLEARGIRHHRSSVAHPQTQGLIERWHRTLGTFIKAQPSHLKWAHRALVGVMIYNKTPLKALGMRSPLEEWYQPQLPQPDHATQLMESDSEYASSDGAFEFEIGQAILWKDPNAPKRKDKFPWKEGVVLEQRGTRGAYLVQFEKGPPKLVNHELMTTCERYSEEDSEAGEENFHSRILEEPEFLDEKAEFESVESQDGGIRPTSPAEEEPVSPVVTTEVPAVHVSTPLLRRSQRNHRAPARYSPEGVRND